MSKNHHSLPVLVASLVFLPTLFPIDAAAVSNNISHSYHANTVLPDAEIVSLDTKHSNYVIPTDINNAPQLIGVTVAPSQSLLAEDSSSSLVQVATSGTVTVLVSSVNGNIGLGDEIAASPFDGIGMKANSNNRIIGLAQTSFNSSTAGSIIKKVKNLQNKLVNVRFGYVQISINIASNYAASANQLDSLQKLVQQLTNKTVSTVRIVISLIILCVALFALISLIYSAIYGSIVAIGRNPLAKNTILRSLRGVIMMSTLIAAVAILAVYFLLQ